jgi:hypothetical protein
MAYETRYRRAGDHSCSCCPNLITTDSERLPAKERVLCDDCLKKAGEGGALLHHGSGDVIFHGSLGIRSFEAGWTA